MNLLSLFRCPERPAHLLRGAEGERIASLFIRGLGYRILARNVHVGKKDEIDIIAEDPVDRVLVFIEVKTRTSSGEYSPEMNVTYEKRRAMARAARAWMRKLNLECGYRMDVVCVMEGKVVDHYRELEIE